MAASSKKTDQTPAVYEIVKAVRNFDIMKSATWKLLKSLSDETRVDNIDAHPAGVVIEPGSDRFNGLATVYVGLKYAGKDKNSIETSDRFPGEFKGYFKDGTPVIESLSLNTQAFSGEATPKSASGTPRHRTSAVGGASRSRRP
jgi:hypothetical protein